MNDILQDHSRWRIIRSFSRDMLESSISLFALGIFVYYFGKFGLLQQNLSVNDIESFIVYGSGKIMFFIGLIIALFLLQNLFLMLVDILTQNCRVEQIKVLKVKRYLKITNSKRLRYGLFIVVLFENGQIAKLKSNDVDIKSGNLYNASICNYSKRIANFSPCSTTTESNIYHSYDEKYIIKHSAIYNFLEATGLVSECYSKEKIIFNFLVLIEALATLACLYTVLFAKA